MSDHHTQPQCEDSGARAAGIDAVVRQVLGPLAGVGVYLLLGAVSPGMPDSARRCAGLLTLMAVWWVSEALPLAVTSLLPLALLPILGITDGKAAAAPYADRIIFIFLGGFILALGMEKWNLHRRIALHIVAMVGTRPSRLVGGFMLATALLSMWMSNTATTLMMLPIGMSIVTLLESRTGKPAGNFAVCIVLGIAYAASIGGVATPIGSPPNAIMLGILDRAHGASVSFASWLLAGVPLMFAMLLGAWLALTKLILPIRLPEIPGEHSLIRDEIRKLGPMSRGEWSVLGAFSLTVAGWVLREPLKLLFNAVGAEGGALRAAAAVLDKQIDDTTVAILGAVLLFMIPVNLKRGEFAMDWRTAAKMPWGVLLLFGGGLSLAAGVQASGLDVAMGERLKGLHELHPVVFLLIVAAVSTFGSEVMSNVAQTNIFMPILGVMAVGAGMDPLLLMFPATMALSCAFMMPMGTAPNALAFGTGRVTIRQMAWAGLWLNLISIALVTLHARTIVPWIIAK